jgi:hypothetical protein
VGNEVASAISRANIWIRTQETKLPSTTPTDPGKIAVQVEMRAVLRSLPSPYAALATALENGDTRPAEAVLAAPDLCCPLPDGKRDELAALMKRAAAANDPELAQAQALREGVAMLEESYGRFKDLLIGLGKDAQASGAPVSDEFAAATGYDRNLLRSA